jgi:hypothetical protein
MLVVQIQVEKFEIRDVLLNGGFDVNINFESLRKKLGLRILQLTSFVVQMANEMKV